MSNLVNKLILQARRWYACQFLGDVLDVTLGYTFSPIRVEGVVPLKTGKSIFILSFLHLNYPSGVQDKRYKLKIMYHKRSYILAKSLDHGEYNPRLLYIHEISEEWVKKIYGENYRFPDRTLNEQLDSEKSFTNSNL